MSPVAKMVAADFGLDVTQPADRVVATILADLRGRKGLRHEWDNIDEDIQAEIVGEWLMLASGAIRESP